MSFKSFLAVGAATSILTGFGAMAPAIAQETTDTEARLDTVTVSAQRREQNLQDVPVAVTALSTQDLEENQVADLTDLQYQIPNISLATGTGTANSARIFLRGVGEDESRGAVDPAVGIYVDGIYIGRQVGSLFDVVDLAQIEVLRGPQGTLYGRNTIGGAIKLVSVRPQMENSGEVRTTLGNYGRIDGRLTGNVQLGENTAVRATGLYRQREGFHGLTPNGDFAGRNKDVGEVDTAAFRIGVSHDFNADWNLYVAYDYTNDNSDPVPDSAAPGNDRDNDVFSIEPLPGTTCSRFAPANFLPLGCFEGYDSRITTQGYTANLTGEIGNFTFESLTGYRELTDDLATRIGFPYFQQTDQDQFSQEFTLASNFDGPFNFLAGVYYFTEDLVFDSVFVTPSTLSADTESVSVFGNGSYEFSDRLTLTAGLRYTDETKDFSGLNLASNLGRTASADFEDLSYSASLDYQFTDAIMGYVKYATGFKSGGWSPDCFGPAACYLPVDEENLDSFEVGVRSDLFDDRLRFNATYFFNNYEGLQIGATVPGVGFTRFNVNETEIQGLEFETTLKVTDRFEINANLGLLDGEYTDVTLSQAGGLTNQGAACPGGVVTIACALGLELKNAPEYKGAVGAIYRMPFAEGEISFGGNIQFEDDSFSLVANSPPHALTDPGTLFNARIAYETDAFTAAIWGQNLSDEEYWRASSGNSFTTYAAPPLTFGVDFALRFGG